MGDYKVMEVGNLISGGGGEIRHLYKQFRRLGYGYTSFGNHRQLKGNFRELRGRDLEKFEIFFYDERLFDGHNTDIYILKKWISGTAADGIMRVEAKEIIEPEEKVKAYEKLLELDLIKEPITEVALEGVDRGKFSSKANFQESEGGGKRKSKKRKSKKRKSKRKQSKKSRKRSKTRRRR